MTERPPLPRPGSLGLIQYAGVDMHAYADACNAALLKNMDESTKNVLLQQEHLIIAHEKRIKVLEDALHSIAWTRGPGTASKLVEVLESKALAALEKTE